MRVGVSHRQTIEPIGRRHCIFVKEGDNRTLRHSNAGIPRARKSA
jgi:hypothetical protein